jgi:hypothetical protein
VEQGEKLSRVPLHSVRTPNSHTKPREANEGEILLLILGGLHERHALQRGILVPTQHYALRTEENHGKH